MNAAGRELALQMALGRIAFAGRVCTDHQRSLRNRLDECPVCIAREALSATEDPAHPPCGPFAYSPRPQQPSFKSEFRRQWRIAIIVLAVSLAVVVLAAAVF